MVAAAGVSRSEFGRTCGVAAYLDDLSIVAPPRIAAVELRAFQRAVAQRGWRVNCDKTVCGVEQKSGQSNTTVWWYGEEQFVVGYLAHARL